MIDKKTFGAFIKNKRIEKNYSQKELAELLYVTEGAVSKWERGISYPDITMVSDICRALDISEHEFITASTDTATRKLKHEARQFRIIRGTWFWVPTISYAVALVVCFICNIAVNNTLSWFFIVLASLVCAYSFIPTYTSFFEANKLLVFVASSLASICLLLLTCAVYTSSVYWVPTACFGIMIGYSLLFIPMVLAKTKVRKYRFIIAFGGAFLSTVLLLLSIYPWEPFMLTPAILMVCYGFIPAIVCTGICILKFNGFLKAGICTLIATVICYFSWHVVNALFGSTDNYYQVDFTNWEKCTNGNITLITLVVMLIVSAVFLGIGIYKQKHDLNGDN